MSDAALLSLGFAAAFGGMALFALSIAAHWRQAFGEWPQPRAMRMTLRFGGAGLLTAAFALCAAADPVSMAVLVWTMMLTAAAALVAFAFTLDSQRTVRRREASRPSSFKMNRGKF